MAGGSNGYRVSPVWGQLTPGLTSLSPETVGSPPFICFSTGYRRRSSTKRKTRIAHQTVQNDAAIVRIRPL
jgi:hypothetical protein